MSNILIAIAGPTAIGKTNFAIQLAKILQCEIISCDSRQFYKELTIGTAVPSTEELASVKHHFIQTHSVSELYTAGQFETDALLVVQELFKNNKYVIVVGGSGLYFNALLNGLDTFPKVSPDAKKEVQHIYDSQGLIGLQKKLQQLDSLYYQTVDQSNPRRMMRALEVCLSSGVPYSTFRTGKAAKRNFEVLKIGLEAPRVELYNRINSRVDLMLENGLLQEAKQVYDLRHLIALQTVGYKELFDFLDGKTSFEIAVEEIKKNTRRYAKRQLTWFKKDQEIRWIDFQTTIEQVLIDFPDL